MHFKKFLFFCFIQLACYASSYEAFDIYGSKRINPTLFFERYQDSFDKCLASDDVDQKIALEQQIQKDFDFAYVRLSVITYFAPERRYVTLDLVEEQDKATRMAFQPSPNGRYADPGNLLKLWEEYMQVGIELVKQGEIDFKNVKCRAFHSIFGHHHPRLAPYEDRFLEGARQYQGELTDIFLKDSDPTKRANAAFVLAYLPDGEALVRLLSQRLFDEDEQVRNNILRVFAVMAMEHPEVQLPIEEVIKFLNYPSTTDRNKAAGTLYGVVFHKETLTRYHSQLVQAVPVLLELLKLYQPNNHDWAYAILKLLSGKDFGDRDYESWQNWYINLSTSN